MSIKIYQPSELSNPEYQALAQCSGSFLHTLFAENPAQARFGEHEASKALDFGIWGHAMILEPERFDSEYCRDFDPSVYESILDTGAQMSAWLKERGIKSSGVKAELIERILAADPDAHIADVEAQRYRSEREGLEFVPPASFDKIQQMRSVIMADPECAKMLANGHAELSLVSDEFKVRPDIITSGAYLINYKTTASAHPEECGRKFYDYGYVMKAAFECEMFRQAYGEMPRGYIILAQQKKAPYIHVPFRLSKETLEIGKKDMNCAIRVYRACRDADTWPAFGGLQDLTLPEYITKKYQ